MISQTFTTRSTTLLKIANKWFLPLCQSNPGNQRRRTSTATWALEAEALVVAAAVAMGLERAAAPTSTTSGAARSTWAAPSFASPSGPARTPCASYPDPSTRTWALRPNFDLVAAAAAVVAAAVAVVALTRWYARRRSAWETCSVKIHSRLGWAGLDFNIHTSSLKKQTVQNNMKFESYIEMEELGFDWEKSGELHSIKTVNNSSSTQAIWYKMF